MIASRFVVLAFMALVVLLPACGRSDKTEQSRAAYEQQQKERRESALQLAERMAHRTNAVMGWKEKLGSTEIGSLNRVYTIDIERLWKQERPILFVGVLEDVANYSERSYHLFVRDYDVFFPELRLHVTCDKKTVDPVLQEVRKDKKSIKAGGIVVAARVTKVTHEMEIDKEHTRHIFVGHGECIELVHIGDAFFEL